jgi:hypothetical protein
MVPYSKLPKQPKDQDNYKDEAQNTAQASGPVSIVAVSTAAQEQNKQHDYQNCCHG